MMKNIKWPAPLRVIGRAVVDWWDGWLDFEIITIVWFFAQWTVVLGPPATFGLYHVVGVLLHDGEATGLKGMFQGAKMYFWKSLLWGLLNWVVAILVYVNLSFYSQMANMLGAVAQWVVIILSVAWLVTQFYAVAFFMQQTEEKVFLALRNGFYLAMGTPIFTLVLVVFSAVLIALCAGLVIPIFLGVPALVAVLSTRALFDRLEAFGIRKKDPDPREVG